jgi:peptidyl-prolyl cis-trans isomerase SurA
MKFYIKLILTIFFSMITSFVFAATSPNALDNIVATVNDAVITQSELKHEVSTVKKQIAGNNMPLPPENALHKQVLDQLINRKLQLQLATQSNLSVTETDIDHAITQIAKLNQIPAADIYKKVGAQGMSKEDYRKELHDEILLQKIQQQEVGSKIAISPHEIDNFMHSNSLSAFGNKEYHLEDILIALPDEPTSDQITQAKHRAESILTRIQHGINFRQAAMSESTNAHALQGGDLGWRKIPEIPTIFAEQVVHAKLNDIIGPIKAPNGFHLIHLAAVRDAANAAHETKVGQRQHIQQLIFQRKLEEGLQAWITKLRSAAYITIAPETEMV